MRVTSSLRCAALVAGLSLLISTVPASVASAQNSILLLMARFDSPETTSTIFAELSLTLDNSDQISTVTLNINGTDYSVPFDFDRWELEFEFLDLGAAKTTLDGLWTITIVGVTSSVSTFDFDAASLQESDFYAVPTNLSPAEGAEGVSTGVTLMWDDPTGAATPFVLGVNVGRNFGSGEQEALSIDGEIAVDATSWTPPVILGPGFNEFSVFYADTGEFFVTDIDATGQPIVWSNSPFAPMGYPSPRALVALGSEAETQFNVELKEDFEAYPIQSDTTGAPDGEGGTAYSVTQAGGAAVAEVGDALASSTGIADDTGDQIWTLGAASGMTGSIGGFEGFLLIGGLPASSPGPGGPFAVYFATPQILFDTKIEADIRKNSGTEDTQMRFLLSDNSGNKIASDPESITGVFQTYSANSFDINTLVESQNFDFFQVTSVNIEFFIDPLPQQPVAVGALEFAVDDVRLTGVVPEPTHAVLQAAAVLVLAGVAARRRRQ